MTATRLGTPLSPRLPDPIPKTDDKTPGYGWTLSDQAKRDIEQIEANAREAEARAGSLFLR
ncbi:MAG TPA: hypothetical protein VGH86_10025 [Phenylobacterium sp.]|jgi:hypothetical protein